MPRFSNALLGALALHGLLLLVRSRHGELSDLNRPEPAAEQFIDLDDLPPTDARVTARAEGDPAFGAADSASAVPAARIARAEPRAVSSWQLPSLPAAASADTDAVDVSEQTAPGEAAPAEPERSVDLGLDGHFFLGPASEMLPRIRKADVKSRPDPQERLQNALAAEDVQRGLARGNELVGPLNTAAREVGPVRGEALFRVTVGADGGVLSADLVQGVSSAWSAALSSFRALAARKRLRVPPGARGLRVTFSVKAKVQRPSGKEADSSPVGVAGPSLNPNGLVPHGDFDLADLGGGGQRLVYARVVAEEVL